MGLKITQVDAFTNRPFAGNPAAVCLLPEARDEEWMQHVAREMNLAETAFLLRRDDGFQLRWFTPAIEVDLCGHATLAAAHVLWEEGHLPPAETARFHTRSGLLTAERGGEWITMDFPAEPAVETEPPAGLVEALGVTPIFIGRNRMDILAVVATAAEVHAAQPNMPQLKHASGRGVIITGPGEGDGDGYGDNFGSGKIDFISRFFAPAAGIDEDPVTGSAHCCLAPYWSARLNRAELTGYQASARGGVVRVQMRGERVGLSGQAVTVLRGELVGVN
jgi:PhzF family phenazine biosynthesis protein